jgi:hypothetical protein
MSGLLVEDRKRCLSLHFYDRKIKIHLQEVQDTSLDFALQFSGR